ncbi:hypothetical protein ABR33_05850 [Enterobacter bugandensis]|uniref:hypothetical protein n=1 Tax=Enterobacter bugandensis TaxID=881260 RepID=UPI0006435F8E|nr:hypothetical protein [Enterobacter bugandensis]KLQ32518.1 hypothetical protein ABR33_05850 [Enterobacter bugandensis]
MISDRRYHFLGGPLNGRHFATGKDEIHDVHGLVDFPPTPEAWAAYRDAAAATEPGQEPPPIPPRVEYRISATECHQVGLEVVADYYMVPATLAPDQDLLFLCRLARSAIDKLNDAKASS